jgi:hypothetical protein
VYTLLQLPENWQVQGLHPITGVTLTGEYNCMGNPSPATRPALEADRAMNRSACPYGAPIAGAAHDLLH